MVYGIVIPTLDRRNEAFSNTILSCNTTIDGDFPVRYVRHNTTIDEDFINSDIIFVLVI